MKHLFYVRHGETEMNVTRAWSGHSETPLTENGRAQAKATGQNLKEHPVKIDLIVCSPLSRARHTAEIIADEIGYPKGKIMTSDLLKERNFGAMEGKQTEDMFDKDSFTLEHLDSVDGAEKLADFHARAEDALAYLKSLPQDNILVVSHGGFGRAIRRVIEGLPHTAEYEPGHYEKYRLGNAELIELI